MSPLGIKFDDQKLLETASADDVFSVIGSPLLSVDQSELHLGRTRIDANKVGEGSKEGLDWVIRRSSGVYAIEFDRGLYIGSTSGRSNYFQRRFKQHYESIKKSEANPSRKINLIGRQSKSMVFHVLARTKTATEARWKEYSCIHWMSTFAPHLLVNDEESGVDRDRTEGSEQQRNSQLRIKSLVTRKKITLAKKLR
jgi:hypothetical protein